MRRRGLGIRLVVVVVILLTLLWALVSLDIWYTARQAEREAPQPTDAGPPSTAVE